MDMSFQIVKRDPQEWAETTARFEKIERAARAYVRATPELLPCYRRDGIGGTYQESDSLAVVQLGDSRGEAWHVKVVREGVEWRGIAHVKGFY